MVLAIAQLGGSEIPVVEDKRLVTHSPSRWLQSLNSSSLPAREHGA